MNILIVDDEYYIVQGIVDSICWNSLGIENIYKAYCIEQAQKIIECKNIDLLLTDIEMPHGSGLHLLEWIQKNGYDITTLILTGHQRFDYALKAINMHCFSYILKPVDKQVLNAELQKAIKKRNATLPEQTNKITLNTQEDENFTSMVRKYIYDHLDSPELNRLEIAEAMHMNPDYLSCLFHKKYGQTLNTYITEKRIDAAKELLMNTTLYLQTISEKTGFSNSSYFHKQFKKVTGLTPQQYRNQGNMSVPSSS
jgi:two-component system response regulator YesN